MTEKRICRENWGDVLDDPEPKAVRWAQREDRFRNATWSKLHYSEGNFYKTACDRPIIPFIVDGSPEERDIEWVDCKRCLKIMKSHNVELTGRGTRDKNNETDL